MGRVTVGGAVLLLLAFGSRGQQGTLPDFDHIQVEVHKVAGAIYMLSGAGGNIGVSVGNDGVVMVDAEYPQMTQKIAAAIKTLSDAPVRYIINTHWHLDHTSGDVDWAKHGTIVIAQENVRRVLASGTIRDGAKIPAAAKQGRPVITYTDAASLYANGEEIRLTHLTHSHTGGDTAVYFTGSHVLDLGDNYRTDGFPPVDQDNGGSVAGMIAALDQVMGSYPADTKLIPGHGPQPMTVADIKPFADMLRDCRAIVQEGASEGKTAGQLKKEKVLSKYEKYTHPIVTTDHFIDVLYRDVTDNKSPAAKAKQ